jgi:hypothetical protein
MDSYWTKIVYYIFTFQEATGKKKKSDVTEHGGNSNKKEKEKEKEHPSSERNRKSRGRQDVVLRSLCPFVTYMDSMTGFI